MSSVLFGNPGRVSGLRVRLIGSVVLKSSTKCLELCRCQPLNAQQAEQAGAMQEVVKQWAEIIWSGIMP